MGARHAILSSLTLVIALSACRPSASTPESTQPAASAVTQGVARGAAVEGSGETVSPESSARETAQAQTSQTSGPATEEGSAGSPACSVDDDCQAPLRCIDATCATPPAISGEVTDATPFVIFHGAEGDARFFLETARTRPEQARGLMFRREMREDWGMVFIFPTEAPRSFWMRNTLIPLDMVFVDAGGTVVNVVANAEPLTESPRRSTGPARYVIELVGGAAAEHGIGPGTRVELLNLSPSETPGSPAAADHPPR